MSSFMYIFLLLTKFFFYLIKKKKLPSFFFPLESAANLGQMMLMSISRKQECGYNLPSCGDLYDCL